MQIRDWKSSFGLVIVIKENQPTCYIAKKSKIINVNDSAFMIARYRTVFRSVFADFSIVSERKPQTANVSLASRNLSLKII